MSAIDPSLLRIDKVIFIHHNQSKLIEKICEFRRESRKSVNFGERACSAEAKLYNDLTIVGTNGSLVLERYTCKLGRMHCQIVERYKALKNYGFPEPVGSTTMTSYNDRSASTANVCSSFKIKLPRRTHKLSTTFSFSLRVLVEAIVCVEKARYKFLIIIIILLLSTLM